jgi:hypothetical protein
MSFFRPALADSKNSMRTIIDTKNTMIAKGIDLIEIARPIAKARKTATAIKLLIKLSMVISLLSKVV